MANTILTPTAVTRESLRVLHQKLNFVGSINREYDSSFAKEGAKIGSDLKIRLPNQYTVRTGRTMAVNDTTESSTTLTVSTQKGVDMSFTSADLTLSLQDFSKRIITPAMSVLAAAIEADALSMYKNVYQQVNNHAAAITMSKVLQARKKMVDSLTPVDDDWTALLNTQDNVDLVDALKGLFQDSAAIKEQYREGVMGKTAGFTFAENTLLPSHTRGGANTSYTVDTRTSNLPTTLPNTPVSSLTTSSGSGTIVVGDVFTIGNCFAVHPESKVSTGQLQQFTATAVMAAAGALAFDPPIILAGAKQNVVIPTTSATAAVAVAGTIDTAHGISLAYHKDAFTFATADLIMPDGVDFAARKTMDGISMRIVRAFDINNDAMPCRVDVLYGYKAIRPQLAVRLANQ